MPSCLVRRLPSQPPQVSGLGFLPRILTGAIAVIAFALAGCTTPLDIDPEPQFSGHPQDPCPTEIEARTGQPASNCQSREPDYDRIRNSSGDIDMGRDICRDTWERLNGLMDEGNVFGFDHQQTGWWEGNQTVIRDQIWVANFLWNIQNYHSGLLTELMHEAGHSLFGESHGGWVEEVESCVMW